MAYIEIKQRKDGQVGYVVRWRANGSRTGKRESEIFDDRKAAERFRDLVKGHGEQWPPGWIRGQGFVADLCSPEEMFEPFAMKQIELLTGVQGDTRAKYRRLVEQNMSPWFKSYSVRDGEGGITREMVQRWVNDLAAGRPAPHDPKDRRPRTKYKPKTIANQHGLLHAILQAAVDAEPPLRSTNPCDFTRLPRLDGEQVEEEMVFLEREEFAWVHRCLAEDARDLAEALAETGARWGEVTALQPRDLCRRNGLPAIRIQRAWKRDEDGRPYLGAPKTKKSRRTIVITSRLERMLRRRAKGKAPDDLLFTGPEGGRWDAGTFRRLRWVPAIERAAQEFGLTKRPRIHDLRHSHASWLIAAKVPLPAIQARLGHESITTTVDRYGHLLDALDGEVLAAVEWAMDPAAPLPGALRLTGSADAANGMRQVPHQRSGPVPNGWTNADRTPGAEPAQGIGPVFVVTLGGQEVAFADRDLAQQVADQWNDDHAEEMEALRVRGWPEDKVARRGAVGPEEVERWVGGEPVWTRMPHRQFVHFATAAYRADGTLAYEPLPVTSRWTWEFEGDSFTVRAAEHRVGQESVGRPAVHQEGRRVERGHLAGGAAQHGHRSRRRQGRPDVRGVDDRRERESEGPGQAHRRQLVRRPGLRLRGVGQDRSGHRRLRQAEARCDVHVPDLRLRRRPVRDVLVAVGRLPHRSLRDLPRPAGVFHDRLDEAGRHPDHAHRSR
ncbi:site-specific integrase [Streptomyces thermoviolaceus]|uniref:tyrosine-type recombinase/integrase n=1 Tax=Streptomyces thermoviolaceus TaxID=1952 RepID=UPI00203AB05E|nr:site-specific integrase [Streptomyces thermoviolaceus]MCM3266352.1 site-specific integrase [Streptomyces thermoviolaceus]